MFARACNALLRGEAIVSEARCTALPSAALDSLFKWRIIAPERRKKKCRSREQNYNEIGISRRARIRYLDVRHHTHAHTVASSAPFGNIRRSRDRRHMYPPSIGPPGANEALIYLNSTRGLAPRLVSSRSLPIATITKFNKDDRTYRTLVRHQSRLLHFVRCRQTSSSEQSSFLTDVTIVVSDATNFVVTGKNDSEEVRIFDGRIHFIRRVCRACRDQLYIARRTRKFPKKGFFSFDETRRVTSGILPRVVLKLTFNIFHSNLETERLLKPTYASGSSDSAADFGENVAASAIDTTSV